MGRDNSKPAHERKAFECFLRESGLDIDPQTIENREPPEPDILCKTFDGECVAFELVSLRCEELERKINNLILGGGGVSQLIWTDDPTADVIGRKLRKSYDSSWPINLLCDALNTLTPDDMVIDEIQHVLNEQGYGPFQSVWFHGEKDVRKFG